MGDRQDATDGLPPVGNPVEYRAGMGHTIELVIWWLFWAVVIGAIAGGIGLVWRRVTGQTWTDVHILEAAAATGLVLSFVGLIILVAMPS